MFQNKILLLAVALTLTLSAKPVDLDDLEGSWHLRVMDGNEVRKARAILDFDPDKMMISGFDGCNRITGKLKRAKYDHLFSKLTINKMACRQNIHRYVSKRLHETVGEGFTVKEERKYGVNGITLKSAKHELFFKRMGEKSKWF